MNAKIAKELRRIVSEASRSGAPAESWQIHTRTGVVRVDPKSDRGAYRTLKRLVEKDPRAMDDIRATAAYKRLIAQDKIFH